MSYECCSKRLRTDFPLVSKFVATALAMTALTTNLLAKANNCVLDQPRSYSSPAGRSPIETSW